MNRPVLRKRTGKKLELVEEQSAGRRRVLFPAVKGRTVDAIELYTSADYHTITVRFQDQTQICLTLETGFTVRARLGDFKSGEERVLRRWADIQSV